MSVEYNFLWVPFDLCKKFPEVIKTFFFFFGIPYTNEVKFLVKVLTDIHSLYIYIYTICDV